MGEKMKKQKILIVVLIILVFVFATANIVQYNINISLKADYKKVEKEMSFQKQEKECYITASDSYYDLLTEIREKNEELEEKVDFLDNYIGIVNSKDDKFYHKYGCELLDTSSFYAFNTATAISKGYHKCKNCH